MHWLIGIGIAATFAIVAILLLRLIVWWLTRRT